MRRLSRFAAILALLAACASAAMPATPPRPVPGLAVADHVPADPLFLWAVKTESAAAELDAVLGLIGEMLPAEEGFDAATGLATIDAKLGVSLHDDLLARLGPELAFVVDLPPFDSLAGLMASPTPESIDRALGRIGFVGQVHEPEAFAKSLHTAMTSLGGVVTGGDGGWSAVFPKQATAPAEPELALYWRIADGWLALGMSPTWAATAASRLAADADLRAGADFKRVASHLDPQPTSLVYLNLPKLAAMVRESGFVQGMASANPEGKAALDVWLKGDRLGIGWGSTSVAVDGGVRTTGFGPELVTGKFFTGVVAAIAIPNLLNAIERGRTKRTMADMRSTATSIEAYAVDNDHYPTLEGWAGPDALAALVAPTYIQIVPSTDAWDHSFRIFSDGEHYVIVSAGPNGEVDHDWTPPIDVAPGPHATDDIVYADGQFVSSPDVMAQQE